MFLDADNDVFVEDLLQGISFDSIHFFCILHYYLHLLNQTEVQVIPHLSQSNQFLNEYAHYV